MDENLIGYVLKALDADEQREVENYLREHPEAHKHLDQLRLRLDLLAHDAGDGEPPAGLWVHALARVAEHKCCTLPSAPPPEEHAPAPRATWWRRADVLVAAVLLILVGGLAVVWVASLTQKSHVVECANNLHQFHQALEAYADVHNGYYPWVEKEWPRNFAGGFVAALNESGTMRPGLSVGCPGTPPQPPSAVSFADLERLKGDEFRNVARTLAGCYAYSLGYQEPGGTALLGLTRVMDDRDRLPIMADAPPSEGGNEVLPGNSANHGGTGQNVLFVGGNVQFRATRRLGADDEDIYLNVNQRVAAGRGARDAVLGRSDAVPFPE
jgi:hypothetical protein